VLIYVDTSKQVGDKDHLKVFADTETAEAWFEENDPEGVAFEYKVLVRQALGSFYERMGANVNRRARKSRRWGATALTHYSHGDASPRLIKPYQPLVREWLAEQSATSRLPELTCWASAMSPA
jgi:hypothetical protein